MKTDALCYQVLQSLPQTYFEAIGAPASTAAGYTFASEELKQAGLRIDGVFLPKRKEDPVHFIEVLFYKTPHAYSNLFAKTFLWLDTKNPAQDWHACLIFANRKLEPDDARPYQPLLDCSKVTRIYLDELPPAGDDQLGLGILKIIASPPEQATELARRWLDREMASREKSVAVRRKRIELIELAVLAHFPGLSRKELNRMLNILEEFRDTKVFQELLEEGMEKGMEKGLEKGMEKGIQKGLEEGLEKGRREIALRLLAKNHSVAEVAELTGLSVQRVRALKKTNSRGAN